MIFGRGLGGVSKNGALDQLVCFEALAGGLLGCRRWLQMPMAHCRAFSEAAFLLLCSSSLLSQRGVILDVSFCVCMR